MPLPVSDVRDVRVLTPRVRRAIDGPQASSSAAVSASLTDDQVKDLIADACADILLYMRGLFGHSLQVTATDPTYGAPTEFITDTPLAPEEQTVIVAQAALNYFFHEFKLLKVSQTIQNEVQQWSYDLSPNLLVAQLKLLQDTRDRALEALTDVRNIGVDTFRSFLAVRDQTTSMAIEPYVDPQGYDAPYWTDLRFPYF